MGTRRSRHNKGRKPLYKEFERETIRHWGDDQAPHLPERLMIQQPIKHRTPVPAKAAELLPAVAHYLARRRAENARKEANEVFPPLPPTPVTQFLSDEQITIVSGARHSSNNDVLMQLWIERKITIAKFQIGRRWQRFHEEATLQPNATINWSRVSRFGGYQQRGDLSDFQIGAMQWRGRFLDAAGPAAYAFADFGLELDRGVDDLKRLLKIDGKQLERIMFDLLSQMLRVYVLNERNAA